MMEIEHTCPTYWAKIFISGDYTMAKQSCREFVMKGLCVNVTQVDFVYTMGEETGVCVELINYPRFPSSDNLILDSAKELADKLLIDLCQGSYSIMTPTETIYHSRREQG